MREENDRSDLLTLQVTGIDGTKSTTAAQPREAAKAWGGNPPACLFRSKGQVSRPVGAGFETRASGCEPSRVSCGERGRRGIRLEVGKVEGE